MRTNRREKNWESRACNFRYGIMAFYRPQYFNLRLCTNEPRDKLMAMGLNYAAIDLDPVNIIIVLLSRNNKLFIFS